MSQKNKINKKKKRNNFKRLKKNFFKNVKLYKFYKKIYLF
jgi:hypothetical protein